MKNHFAWEARIVALALGVAAFAGGTAVAEPSIHRPDAEAIDGRPLRIDGDGFGDKTPAKPLVWADFNRGAEPTSKGLRRKWDGVEHLVWSPSCDDGSGCMKAADDSGIWTLRVDNRYWTTPGARLYVRRRQRMNFVITDPSQNWKIWRMWPNNADGNYPNLWIGGSNGRIAVEELGTEGGFWSGFRSPQSTDWMTEEIQFQASNRDAKDGVLVFRCNGAEMFTGNVMTSSSKKPALMEKNFVVHAVAANRGRWSPPWSPENRVWVDDVYVDTTWSHVMIGDRPDLFESRALEIQIPIAWSPTSILVDARVDRFEKGSVVYLFVFDRDGRANRIGAPVRVGPALVARAAPESGR